MRGIANIPEGHAAFQRDEDKLEKWSDRNLIKFKKEKFEAVCLGSRYRTSGTNISWGHPAGKQLDRKGPAVLVDKKLIMS